MTPSLKIISVAAVCAALCTLAFLLLAPNDAETESEEDAFLAGRTIDAVTALPVPYADIIASNTINHQNYSVQSDANGNFALSTQAGHYTVEGQKVGYVKGPKRSLTLQSGMRYINVAVKMLKMSTLTGQITDNDNQNTAAELSLQCDNGYESIQNTLGSFSFESLTQSTCRLTAKSPGYVSVLLPDINIPDGSTIEIPTIRLQKAKTIQGKVRDAWSKDGIEGVKITVNDNAVITYSDAQGHYTVDLNPRLNHTLAFSKKGYDNAYFDADNRKIFDIDLKANNKILVRIIRDVERQHTPCKITLKEENSHKITEIKPTNDTVALPVNDGVFTVSLQTSEDTSLPFKNEIIEHLALPGDVVVFRLNRLAAVTINIKENNMPVATGFYSLARVRNNQVSDNTYSAPGAFFSDNAMTEGSYRFNYRKNEHSLPIFERDFTLAPGDEEIFEWEINTDQELTSFNGFIATPDGQPLAKAAVYYNDPESGNPDDPDGDLMIVYTDADGYFEIENLPLQYRFSVYVIKDEDNIQIYTGLLSGGSRHFIFTGSL